MKRLYIPRLFVQLMLIVLLILLPFSASIPGNMPAHAAAATQTVVVANDGLARDAFGAAIAISGDIVAIGAPYAAINGVSTAGAVYLYQRAPQGGGWTLLQKLTRNPPARNGQFGEQLALQNGTLVVGAPHEAGSHGIQQGAVYVYDRDQANTSQWNLTTTLKDDTLAAVSLFGGSVALDGDLVVVGAAGASEHMGAAYVYSRAANWALQKKLTDAHGHLSAQFGSAVAIAGDTVVIGADRTNQSMLTPQYEGAAFVFERNQGGANNWGQSVRLAPEVQLANAAFGHAVAIVGNTVVVGEPFRDVVVQGQIAEYSVGAAWVFERNQGGANAWGRVQQLSSPAGAAFDYFGNHVAITSNDIWVSVHTADVSGYTDQGMVYHYQRGSSVWDATDPVVSDDGLPGDYFGSALAASGTTLAVGAAGRSTGRGQAYLLAETKSPTSIAYSQYLPVIANASYPLTGMLSDGGVLTASGGAKLGVVAGTLDIPLGATLMPIAAPSTPLPQQIQPVGGYYLVAAQNPIALPADKPLLVGLPVAGTANPAELAAAAFLPNDDATEYDDQTTSGWIMIPGAYDSASKLFVFTLSELLPSGTTLVLYAHPQNRPLSIPAQSMQQQAVDVHFEVACDTLRDKAACTPANQQLVAQEMLDAYNVFVVSHGFQKPNMVHLIGDFGAGGAQPHLVETYYRVRIATNPCTSDGEPVAGLYEYASLGILICMNVNSSSDAIREVVRHELFHAIQASYSRTSFDHLDPNRAARTDWLIEGTAAAAARSSYLLLRELQFPLREITTPLTSTLKLNEYSAQDFWVYTGRELGEPIAYLQPILAQGATPGHVDKALDMETAYWSWVKNQGFEHHETMDGAFFHPACERELLVFDPTLTNFIFYPLEHLTEGNLPPLTAGLVKVSFKNQTAFAQISAASNDPNATMAYKVYQNGEAGCQLVPDGQRVFMNLAAGSDRYVLVANLSMTDDLQYVVQVVGE